VSPVIRIPADGANVPLGAAMSAKLNPPAAASTQVLRSAVGDRICGPGAVKVVLVHAPAGFGKTTAMLQSFARLQAAGTETAWLTLDRADNDLSRFLNGFGRAVAQLSGDLPPRSSAAFDVVEALGGLQSPFALFLDEFELIQEPAVLGLLREVIDHLPRRGQLVIGSRSLPNLGLGRLRGRGELIEVDADHLRFSLAETSEFFQLRNVEAVGAESLSQLHSKTEGWVAALWLASLALERHVESANFIERFSGSHRAVADYLAEDVLAGQRTEVREFLLRTSILRHLNAPLCRALNPHSDAERMLDHLAAANLFLTPLVGEDRAYRYHSLFADFLRAQLAREHPEELARLHLAASGWYEAQDRPVPAIDHAIEGGDFPLALSLMAPHAELFLEQGRMRLMARWFAALPDASLREQPLLEVISIWASCLTHGPWEAMDKLLKSGCVQSADPGVQAHVQALRPMLLAMQDRYDEANAAGRIALARLPTTKPFADSVLSNCMAHVVAVMGEPREAHELLESARRANGGAHFNRMYIESMEGMLDLQQGRMRQAAARFAIAVGATHSVSYNHTSGNAWAGVLYAGAIYEANRLDQAEHLLSVYLPLARDVGLPDHVIMSHVMRSRIAFHHGDIDAAQHALTELEYIGHHRELPRVSASARLERARLLMLQGNADASKNELERAGDPALWERVTRLRLYAHDLDDLTIGRLRWDLLFGDARAALPRIQQEINLAERGSRLRRALKLRVLQALALQRGDEMVSALDVIGGALQQACQEGFVRLVLDEGNAVGTLIHRFGASLQERFGRPRDPILSNYVQGLIAILGPAATSEAEAQAPGASNGLLEPLTRKEIRVLQLLAEGYSNNAMADKLFVSDSTVRTHLRNINMKLNAHSRTQAVAIARKLAVIR
jgi:LuxR family maltose regulon positive regulatory protein